MDLLRRFASWSCLYLVGTFFFLTAGSFALFHVLSADNIKSTLREEKIYDNLVPSFLSTARYEGQTVQGQVPLDEPWVRHAAEKAFPAEDLEKKTGQAIDGTFEWLEGKTDKPEYRLDFRDNKLRLSEEVGASAESRLSGLPRCSFGQIPDSIDAFRASCLPLGVSPRLLAESVRNQVLSDEEFLGDGIFTSDDLKLDPLGEKTAGNPLSRLGSLRDVYRHKDVLMWLLPLITLLLGGLGVYIAADRLKALRRLGRSFIASAVGLFLLAFLLWFGFRPLLNLTDDNVVTRDLIAPVVLSLASQASLIYLIFSGVAALLALVSYRLRKRFTPFSPLGR